jgi:hypothetical protein
VLRARRRSSHEDFTAVAAAGYTVKKGYRFSAGPEHQGPLVLRARRRSSHEDFTAVAAAGYTVKKVIVFQLELSTSGRRRCGLDEEVATKTSPLSPPRATLKKRL